MMLVFADCVFNIGEMGNIRKLKIKGAIITKEELKKLVWLMEKMRKDIE
jgi:hypothetical protein